MVLVILARDTEKMCRSFCTAADVAGYIRLMLARGLSARLEQTHVISREIEDPQTSYYAPNVRHVFISIRDSKTLELAFLRIWYMVPGFLGISKKFKTQQKASKN